MCVLAVCNHLVVPAPLHAAPEGDGGAEGLGRPPGGHLHTGNLAAWKYIDTLII